MAHFHFRDHLIAKNVIEGYEIFVMRYDAASSVMGLFIVSFRNHEILAKFARSLLDKIFVLTMAKSLGENTFLVEAFLSTNEFRKFTDALSKMVNMNLVQSYEYAIQDLRIRRRQTISGGFFKGKSRIYDHKSTWKYCVRRFQNTFLDLNYCKSLFSNVHTRLMIINRQTRTQK